MDIWRYFDITHREHVFCNPTSPEAVDELGRALRLTDSMRVLDIACGHAEVLIRWSEQHLISGVGVDLSTYALGHAEKRRQARVPDADIRFVQGDGAKFDTDERFDVVSLIGASWIWDGYAGTLQALLRFVKPGGLIVFGEPYWKGDPPDEYLTAEGLTRDGFTTLAGLHRHALENGLDLIWMRDSTLTEWDRYELLQAASFDRFALENPDDPDLAAVRERRKQANAIYLRWGRALCGFAIWAFRAPAA